MACLRIVVALALLGALCLRVSAESEGRFLLLTDFHIDPFYEVQYNADTRCRNSTYWLPGTTAEQMDAGVPDSFFTHRPSNAEVWHSLTPAPEGSWVLPNFNYGQYGCDAPIALVETTLFEAKRLVPDPDFIVFTGDMSAHDLPTWGTRTLSITDGYAALADAFPGVPVYATLGNNDLFPDYFIRDNEIIGDNRWFQNMWNIWESTIGMPDDQESTFVGGGFYSTVAANRTMMISLNTIALCPCRTPDEDHSQDDPFGQMAWFEQQLLAAADQGLAVYIIGHIAPLDGDWYATYLQEYNLLISKYQDIIVAQFFGHNHSDQLHTMFEENSVNPQNGPSGSYTQSPAVTPKNDNNPAFRVVSYNRETFATLDYWQYYMDLLLTQATSRAEFVLEYRFTSLYEQEFFNTDGVYGALQLMARDRQVYYAYKNNKHTQYQSPDDIMDDICELRENTYFGYMRCMLQGLPWILQTNGVAASDASPGEVLASLHISERWAAHPQAEVLVVQALEELAELAI